MPRHQAPLFLFHELDKLHEPIDGVKAKADKNRRHGNATAPNKERIGIGALCKDYRDESREAHQGKDEGRLFNRGFKLFHGYIIL